MGTPNLTFENVQRVVRLIASWEGKITWELVVDKVSLTLRQTYSRQTLQSHFSIKVAFQNAKVRQRRKSANAQPKTKQKDVTAEMAAALSRIEVLKAELEVSKSENTKHMQQFAVWLFNSRRRGVSEVELNQPLPLINRGASEK
ncbi:hypothetical protein [Rhizobium sp. 18055]|uniref:hypothetical protein n=1 Tax=Rhizobium sp. 18055 TaxID=2681403 RepID=UPI001357F92E|nr:hypothetical protein [Rhizobium sp. 18055]